MNGTAVQSFFWICLFMWRWPSYTRVHSNKRLPRMEGGLNALFSQKASTNLKLFFSPARREGEKERDHTACWQRRTCANHFPAPILLLFYCCIFSTLVNVFCLCLSGCLSLSLFLSLSNHGFLFPRCKGNGVRNKQTSFCFTQHSLR